MRLPKLIEVESFLSCQAANISTVSCSLLTIANASRLVAHGRSAQIDVFARSEPDGAIASRATQPGLA
ncbi:MAG: hypothetical protein LBJ65_02540 [Burkholderia sp.]|jgi:hypothetical protein|uniref:hypothetical protein n=1 Tax=Burkholderia sp. TaxID=36773 RepID=UPI00281C14E2|nr:hypothetical protein [Burkholderia sp.]MDR0240458.1 hypothetical protein [Burkholderia sp.]